MLTCMHKVLNALWLITLKLTSSFAFSSSTTLSVLFLISSIKISFWREIKCVSTRKWYSCMRVQGSINLRKKMVKMMSCNSLRLAIALFFMHNGSVRRGSSPPPSPHMLVHSLHLNLHLCWLSVFSITCTGRKVNGKRIVEGAQGLTGFKGVHVQTQPMGIVT